MYSEYFEEWEVRPEYEKEFVSLWSGWLGEKNLHKLDKVTESDWSRFNDFIRRLAKDFKIVLVDCKTESLAEISDVESSLSNYTDSMNKESSQFTQIILPELGCVISEEWDYTYIIWHKNNGAVEALSPYVMQSRLKHFHD